jgi:hypothetical protein
MGYFDTLRRNGWLADPGDRVRVVATHRAGCLSTWGRSCSCNPRLELQANLLPSDVGDAEDENDLPMLDLASGE